jgi:hypothetical protein
MKARMAARNASNSAGVNEETVFLVAMITPWGVDEPDGVDDELQTSIAPIESIVGGRIRYDDGGEHAEPMIARGRPTVALPAMAVAARRPGPSRGIACIRRDSGEVFWSRRSVEA